MASRWTDVIVEGDCVEGMRSMPASCVDHVFADPPYNLQISRDLERPEHTVVDSVFDQWDRFETLQAYDGFTRAWMTAARRVMRPDATIAVIGSYHNVFRLGAILQDLGFWILNDLVWVKANPMPNFRGRRFTNAHETIVWAARSKTSRYTFNYDGLKAGNEDRQVRSDWHMPVCGGPERLQGEDGSKAHPTQKPEALVSRMLLAATRPGDLVLDPFLGSGTTAAVARRHGRSHVGFERDPTHVATARARVAAVVPHAPDLVSPLPGRRQEVRVAFLSLVECGLVTVGETLRCPKGTRQAVVRADGSLVSDHGTGSIHKVGALSLGAATCNGWDHWHVERDGARVPIERLRKDYRAGTAPRGLALAGAPPTIAHPNRDRGTT